MQVQHVRYPIGHRAPSRADTAPGVQVDHIFEQLAAVVVGTGTDKHPGVAAGEGTRRNASVFQCLPGHLEQNSLLRVHQLRLARRQPEKVRVEPVDSTQETASAHGAPQYRGVPNAQLRIRLPAVRWYIRGSVATTAQQIPKGVR